MKKFLLKAIIILVIITVISVLALLLCNPDRLFEDELKYAPKNDTTLVHPCDTIPRSTSTINRLHA